MLNFKPVKEAISDVLPPEVTLMYSEAPDGSMTMLPGICAGALAGVSAQEVFAVCTEDCGPEILDWSFEPPSSISADHNTELNSVAFDVAEPSFPQLVGLLHRGAVRPDEYGVVDFSTDQFAFCVHVRTYIWPFSEDGISYLIEVHLEADGGPPSLLFFVKRDDAAYKRIA